MTRQYIDIQHKWAVIAYHGASPDDGKELVNALQGLKCSEADIERAIDVLSSPNTGFTYSSPKARMSLVAISRTTSKGEYINTIAHESTHVLSAICRYYNIQEDSEEAAYLMGGLVKELSSWVNQ